ncbi:MAG: cobalt-precorrin-7 (C(5))-methyltransferase [Methanomicrobiaceae archaeon]|nr:cobalt-precorrin-7 (C(5))-methyltransferase [Methanomicrobiaceae archaeon]
MKIVGSGCGPGMLTEEAISTIKSADLIYGSKRAIELCKKYIGTNSKVNEITDYKALKNLPEGAVVLSTGDPMLAGLGYLSGKIIPGISSMQYAFAKIKIPLTKAVVVNAHGKDHIAAIKKASEEIERGYIVFLIADPAFDINILCNNLKCINSSLKVSLCENLGYDNERIVTSPISDPPERISSLFVLIIGNF